MKLVIFPPVEPVRLAQIRSAGVGMTVVNAADEAEAVEAVHDADAFLGKIGQEIGRRGLAFGMSVLAIDAVQTQAPPGVRLLGPADHLPTLLAWSDFVVIAAPHTPETVKLFRRPQLRQMKRTAYLINV